MTNIAPIFRFYHVNHVNIVAMNFCVGALKHLYIFTITLARYNWKAFFQRCSPVAPMHMNSLNIELSARSIKCVQYLLILWVHLEDEVVFCLWPNHSVSLDHMSMAGKISLFDHKTHKHTH